MLKFRPSNLTQKRVNISFNELQLIALIEKGLSDNSLRGFLYKRSSPNAKWRLKWFLLFENLLFYFDVGSSSQQQQQQHQQQLILQLPNQSPAKSSGKSAGSTLSSLIRRQSKQPKESCDNNWQQLKQFESQKDVVSKGSKSITIERQVSPELRRASADATTSGALSASPAAAAGVSGSYRELGQSDMTGCRHSSCGSKQVVVSGGGGNASAGDSQYRLGSDCSQAGGALSTGDLTSLSGYDSSAFAAPPVGSFHPLSKTQNSSSISGVSGHFLAHNDQTIGRSTTTTAGKTATSSANYASLLNRKIGVLFLEGSYCERLVDSGANFTGHVNNTIATLTRGGPNSSQSSSTISGGKGSTTTCGASGSNILEMEASRHYNEYSIGGVANNNNNKSSNGIICNINNGSSHESLGFNCIFTLKWRKEGSKEYQFRSETEAECQTWVHAISNARYSTLLNDKEQLEQKYLHLSQIIESESTAKWHYSRQCEEFLAEIKKLRQEICLLKRQESRSNHLKLVLGKSAAIIETIMRQQTRRQRKQQQDEQQQQLQKYQSELAAGLPDTPQKGRPVARPAGSPGSSKLELAGAHLRANRVRSMDQEQEEHEVAVRRTRRCNASLLRLASLDPEPLRCASKQVMHQKAATTIHHERPLTSSTAPRALPAAAPLAAASVRASPHTLPDGSRSHTSGNCEAGTLKVAYNNDDAPAAAAAASEYEEEEDIDVDDQALTIELKTMVEALNNGAILSDCLLEETEDGEEIRKIKKVQGFFRGWLCRRRWKQIVQEYIKSPHAESMRKRNNLVFRMVECEEEYVEQLTLLISAFLRPIKMTASSQRPALNHDELNSIFLNSETLLFLHQIFLKGLTARMESWPTLILGDLFNMLLPMLTIYQEYVRNHHFSLQVLAECKQRDQFSLILRRLEEKPQLNGRTLETFLTYPMHQIPRYIICLHEILAHTPHNHVERKCLYEAQTKLEDLSRQMHDEVSETENIRQNLAIERMIIGGCDILLDVNQVFVRQGILLQVVEQAKGGKSRSKLASFTSRQSNKQSNISQQCLQQQQQHSAQNTDFNAQFGQIINPGSSSYHHATTCDNQATKDLIRQCFLFTNHLLLCTRTKDGKLHLLENFGRISLSEVTLIENPLEFVQQQETIIANFESIPQQQQQHRNPTHNQQLEADSYVDNQPSNNNNHCAEGATQQTDSRTTTSAINNKLNSQRQRQSQQQQQTVQGTKSRKSEKRNSHVGFELDYRVGSVCSGPSTSASAGGLQFSPPLATTSATSGHQEKPSSSSYPFSSISCLTDDSSVTSTPTKQPSSSSRRRLAGYLATKLSNLTSSLASGAGQLQVGSSSSAPPSPLNKRTSSAGDGGINSQSGGQTTTFGALTNSAAAARQRITSGSVSGPSKLTGGGGGGATISGGGSSNSQQPYYFGHHSSFYPPKDYGGCDFILIIEATSNLSGSNSSSQANTNSASNSNHPIVIHLVAPNLQEKAAWMSDISQCIDNVHFNDLFHGSVNDSSSVTINQSVRTDPRLYKDDVDIKFSRALNSCKLPQIRYASKERLFERLTDLRFLSIDFLNTFLLTYRVFTNAEDVLEALKSVHYNCERYYQQQHQQQQQRHQHQHQQQQHQLSRDLAARDSFSVFPNSSLNSLNTNSINTNTLISDQAVEEQQLNDQKSPEKLSKSSQAPICNENMKSSKLMNKSGVRQPDNHQLNGPHHQQKPTIPPRSSSGAAAVTAAAESASSSTFAGPHQQLADQQLQQPKNKFLMAPNANQSQKRRSTISALTPITGSNSSSLANLAIYKTGISDQNSSNQTTLNAPGSCPTSAASSLGRTSECHSPYGSNNLDDLLLESRLSEDESDLLSPPIISCDRLRSSSMTNRSGIDTCQINLDVPTCRQVRASSLSHVGADTRLIAAKQSAAAAAGSGGSETTGVGNEHWRLSYKKATKAKSGGGGAAGMMSQLGPGPSAPRRASSSDVTFHVTLQPPPELSAPQTNEDVDYSQIVGCQDGSLELGPDKLNVFPSPVVPPSTPIDPASPAPESNNMASGERTRTVDRSSRTRKKNAPVEDMMPHHRHHHNHHRKQKTESRSSSEASSSDSSLVASAGSSSSSSLSYADTKSVISSQSESELIQSTSSASLDSSSNEYHDSMTKCSDSAATTKLLPYGSGHPHLKSHHKHSRRFKANYKTKQRSGAKLEAGAKMDELSRRQLTRQQTKQERLMTQKMVIKEIDLTEAKIFDCDTSADEDKVSTSSESDGDMVDKIIENENRSVLILTRLNTVQNDDDAPANSNDAEQEASDGSDMVLIDESKCNADARGSLMIATTNGATTASSIISAPSSATESVALHKSTKVSSEFSDPQSDQPAIIQNRAIDSRSSKGIQGPLTQGQPRSSIDQNRSVSKGAADLEGAASPKQPQLSTTDENPSASKSLQTPIKKSDLSMSSGLSQRSMASAQTVVGLNSIASPSSRMTTPRSSFQQQHANETSCDRISKAGVIVSSSTPRVSSRRSSTASAASAFAAATAASNNPILTQPPPFMKQQQPLNRIGERFDYNNLVDCLCSNFHRASVSSCQSSQQNSGSSVVLPRSIMQPRPSDLASGHRTLQQHQQQQQFLHYPSCIYYQQQQVAVNSPSNTPSNSYPNPQSDASSVCNSRASSRLSSCAGLEYSSYSSAPINLYSTSQQQQFNNTMAKGVGNLQAATNLGLHTRIGSNTANEQSIANQMMQASKYQNQRSSKRNSTQINVRSVATIRVLSVLRHWVSKHSQDFVNDTKLSYLVQEFLQDLIMDSNLLPAEHKAALQLQQMVQKAAHSRGTQVDLDLLLAAPARPSPDSIETLSALEIAEGMTYLDHKIFLAIRSEEFLGQAWMKMDKAMKAPHILLITKRFNDVSRLVSSEIIRVPELHRRVAIIEKWTNVAHICRVVHNFNGVLQICAAFTNSAVFRLKKTWDKIPKTTKTTIDQLQNLVSTDSRFRNMRDAINRCDPPSIPYVGMYLTDLSFIEEGTPNYSPDGLLNFSKMRMIAHVIREIQHLQNGSYKIELNHRVANYLLDASRHLQDDEMYRCSLAIEPRSSGAKNGVQILNSVSGQFNSANNSITQQQPQQQQQQQQQFTTCTPVKGSHQSKN